MVLGWFRSLPQTTTNFSLSERLVIIDVSLCCLFSVPELIDGAADHVQAHGCGGQPGAGHPGVAHPGAAHPGGGHHGAGPAGGVLPGGAQNMQVVL